MASSALPKEPACQKQAQRQQGVASGIEYVNCVGGVCTDNLASSWKHFYLTQFTHPLTAKIYVCSVTLGADVSSEPLKSVVRKFQVSAADPPT